MKLEINDQIVMLHFKHTPLCRRPHDHAAAGCRKTHMTTVFLHEGPCMGRDVTNRCLSLDRAEVPKGQGLAYCAATDQFVRATGRKVALGRALRNLYPMEIGKRRNVWRAYFLATNDLTKMAQVG